MFIAIQSIKKRQEEMAVKTTNGLLTSKRIHRALEEKWRSSAVNYLPLQVPKREARLSARVARVPIEIAFDTDGTL